MFFAITNLRPARIAAFGAIAAAILASSVSHAQVQATRQNTKAFITSVCMDGLNEQGRDAVAKRGKTLTEVCNCTSARMWEKFPSIHFWVQDTTPYERNQINDEFPKTVTACIVE